MFRYFETKTRDLHTKSSADVSQ